ncbi:hypothetical protein H5410_056528 [Solanum commersonii]|uniref:Uncharacterized protein n=1 Tax=Solanum commersonii TaxID=4109 RepID=A0A9J5WLJ8_SOLCO|nr:hypothetical protein H5410_056528 [Solanum commersonii]
MNSVGPNEKTGLLLRSTMPRSGRFVQTSKPAHFHGQMIPEVGKRPSMPIFVCYSHGSFGDLDFLRHFCEKNCGRPSIS